MATALSVALLFSRCRSSDAGEYLADLFDGNNESLACFIRPEALSDHPSAFVEDGTIKSAGKKVVVVLGCIALVGIFVGISCCPCGVAGWIFCTGLKRVRGCIEARPGAQDDAVRPQVAPRHAAGLAQAVPIPRNARVAQADAETERFALTRPQIDKLVGKLPTADDGSASEACSVCLEDGSEAGASRPRAVLLPTCDHYFHAKCIATWLSRGETDCPVCRRDILGLDSK
jgi:Ring finger domain